jgi:hypothetical protein
MIGLTTVDQFEALVNLLRTAANGEVNLRSRRQWERETMSEAERAQSNLGAEEHLKHRIREGVAQKVRSNAQNTVK